MEDICCCLAPTLHESSQREALPARLIVRTAPTARRFFAPREAAKDAKGLRVELPCAIGDVLMVGGHPCSIEGIEQMLRERPST